MVIVLMGSGLVPAAQTVTRPFLGIALYHQTETSPRPLNINVAEIDLAASGVSFQVTPPGPDPRPIGTNPGFAGVPLETVREATRLYTDQIGAQLAINCSYFSSETVNGVFWANNLGLTVSNGNKYSPWELPPNNDNNFDDALNISQSNQAFIVKMPSSVPTGFETLPSVSLYNAVTGKERILQSGVNVAPSTGTDPRTAIGLTAGNSKLLLMTVDGRQPGFSEGVTLAELAGYMASYGATNAISMDGGGSTELAANFYADNQPSLLINSPSQIPERLVGANLAVFALPNGDYNQNGVVDAADYVVWRDSIGGQYAYDAWRQRFGGSVGSGSSQSDTRLVPEARSMWIIVVLAGSLLLGRVRRLRFKVSLINPIGVFGISAGRIIDFC